MPLLLRIGAYVTANVRHPAVLIFCLYQLWLDSTPWQHITVPTKKGKAPIEILMFIILKPSPSYFLQNGTPATL
ncbi:hypothetical protein MKW98_024094 [Papaver atlanticum]|uniref:Uncharacterized protein n=1 Tax=Papaver atlanticum TaxID=357466 RepID=A0AAD4XNB4_9MAGN|nr:hypothetical protein MKW98_024094 [Papaver atlanticum]